MPPSFHQLNQDWNADPNAPVPRVEVDEQDILLLFTLNSLQFKRFTSGDTGVIRFKGCSRYRLGETNDEGWYLGQCRYSHFAPAWGEFYELIGSDGVADEPNDWVNLAAKSPERHFLFYFRDDTFECFAEDWLFEHIKAGGPRSR